VVHALVHDDARWWRSAGAAFGRGTVTKLSAPLCGVLAFGATLALPPARTQLRTGWPWLGALVALVLGAGSITGQMVHDWPLLAQMRIFRAQQLVHVAPRDYLIEQGGCWKVPCCSSAGACDGQWPGACGVRVTRSATRSAHAG
jgi:hypothetical protein